MASMSEHKPDQQRHLAAQIVALGRELLGSNGTLSEFLMSKALNDMVRAALAMHLQTLEACTQLTQLHAYVTIVSHTLRLARSEKRHALEISKMLNCPRAMWCHAWSVHTYHVLLLCLHIIN